MRTLSIRWIVMPGLLHRAAGWWPLVPLGRSRHRILDILHGSGLDRQRNGQWRQQADAGGVAAIHRSRPHPVHWDPAVALGLDDPLVDPERPQPVEILDHLRGQHQVFPGSEAGDPLAMPLPLADLRPQPPAD
jgi:hypothetical protein